MMRKRKNYLRILLLTGVCSLAILGGCGDKEGTAGAGQEEAGAGQAGEASGGAQEGEAPGAAQEEEGSVQAGAEGEGSLGEFTMQDINGETYTQEMFADYDLTMVNVFTTWCSPCIGEIPDLQKLRDEVESQGVNVVGICLDAIGSSGEADPQVVETAKELAERTGVSYPFLIPDASYLNGRLATINAVPETFFVDKEGNIVGETYSGSRSLEEWKGIVETARKGAAE